MSPKSTGKAYIATLGEKVKVIRMNDECKTTALIALEYNMNMNTIREIIKSRNKIITNYAIGPKVVTCIDSVRDSILASVVKALDNYVQEKKSEHVEVDSLTLERAALQFYEKLRSEMKIPAPVVLNTIFSLTSYYTSTPETKYAKYWSRDGFMVRVERALAGWIMGKHPGYVLGKALRDQAMVIYKQRRPEGHVGKPFVPDIRWMNRFCRIFKLKCGDGSSVLGEERENAAEGVLGGVVQTCAASDKGVLASHAVHQQLVKSTSGQHQVNLGGHNEVLSDGIIKPVVPSEPKRVAIDPLMEPPVQPMEPIAVACKCETDGDNLLKPQVEPMESIAAVCKSEPDSDNLLEPRVQPMESTAVVCKSEPDDDYLSAPIENLREKYEKAAAVIDRVINRKHFPTVEKKLSIKQKFLQYLQWPCRRCGKSSIYKCPTCSEKMGLCLECFVPWHVHEKNFLTN